MKLLIETTTQKYLLRFCLTQHILTDTFSLLTVNNLKTKKGILCSASFSSLTLSPISCVILSDQAIITFLNASEVASHKLSKKSPQNEILIFAFICVAESH